MAGTAEEVARLKPITRRLREHVIRMITAAGSGHPGGSLSAAEIVTVLFFHTLRRRQGDPTWPERDRFVISKGHGVPIVYAALAEAGELPVAELATLRKLGSRLQGHPDRVALPWVEAATGSLGQGLSLALGMALASRLDGNRYRVFCLLGDGETQSGQVWEAAMAAGKYKPEKLVVVLDADLASSTNTKAFADRYPERFFQLGIAEGNMVGVAAGLALAGKIPFAASFACFLAGRFEQIRVSVAYNRANVRLVGTHSGVGIGEDGYSQMSPEDLALIRSLPNILG